MSTDDPTLPGTRSARARRASLSTRSLRVVAEVAPILAAAFTMPDGAERDEQLEAAIGHAIDAGREAGESMRAELERLRGELANAVQSQSLLAERNRRLTAALADANARISRLATADRSE